MKTSESSGPTWAFSLIELLCVVAIIGILASFLLPVLSQGRLRARRLQCVSQLHQAGVAFHSFAHDHNNQFPMGVPASAGGSVEFVLEAYRLEGEFYLAYHHFQSLSNDLVAAQVVVCPADTRRPAASFAALRNENLSYFVNAKAEYARPDSILAGDRNITNDWGALAEPATNHTLRWTRDLHGFKGNLLFADSHVEARNSQGFAFVPAETATAASAKTAGESGEGEGAASGEATGLSGAGAVAVPGRAAATNGVGSATNLLAAIGLGMAGLSPWTPAPVDRARVAAGKSQPPPPTGPQIQDPEPKPRSPATNVPGASPAPRREPSPPSVVPASGTNAPSVPGIAAANPKLSYLSLLLLLLLLMALLVILALRRPFKAKCRPAAD